MVMTYIIVILLHYRAQCTKEFTISFFKIIIVKNLSTHKTAYGLTAQHLFLMGQLILATISKQHELTYFFHGMPTWIRIVRHIGNTIIRQMIRNNIEQLILHFIIDPRVESMCNNIIESPHRFVKIQNISLHQGYIL